MKGTRALRVLFVANDGLSVGHVMRTLAIASALSRRAGARRIDVQSVLATTSEADSLLAAVPALAMVRLPAPALARRAGLSDEDRRRLVRGAIDGIVNAFGPDLIVVDTFPSGPHGELTGMGGRRRALVRRSVSHERSRELAEGLETYDLAIVADDPTRSAPVDLPVANVVYVPPITLSEPGDAMSREAARSELGLPTEGRVILVTSGGGGDEQAVRRAQAIATSIAELAPDTSTVLALGPLARSAAATADLRAGVSRAHRPVLAPLLAAFDGVFAPAGYNTAHELAKAGVPAALFAQPRPFDDQAGRAARFAAASLAHALDDVDRPSLERALVWMKSARIARVEGGGADRAADALLDQFTERGRGLRP